MDWQNDNSLINYSTAADTRSLSVTSNLQAISNPKELYNNKTTVAVLFYESPNASVSVLMRTAEPCGSLGCYGPSSPIYTDDSRIFGWTDNSFALQRWDDKYLWSSMGSPFISEEATSDADFRVNFLVHNDLEKLAPHYDKDYDPRNHAQFTTIIFNTTQNTSAQDIYDTNIAWKGGKHRSFMDSDFLSSRLKFVS